MYENNNGVTQEVQAAAPQKKSGGNWVWISFVLVGIALLVIGIILFNNTDVKKYAKIKDFSESYSAADVKRFNLEIGWADLTVSKSNDDKIYVEAKNVPEGFTAGVRGDTFSTEFSEKKIHFYMLPSWLNGSDSNNAVVDIKLPDKEYESFVLDLGAGETETVESAKVEETNVEVESADEAPVETESTDETPAATEEKPKMPWESEE